MATCNPDLDQTFAKIEQGTALETEEKYFDASCSFCKAQELLEVLATTTSTSTEEERKIAQLYRTQQQVYFKRAQSSFIKALQKEHEEDVSDDSATASPMDISDQEAKQRLTTFAALFSKPLKAEEAEEEKPVQEQQVSLEERLVELNKSLPSGFKTSQERMSEINKGLNKLGLSLYSNKDTASLDVEPLSEEDQVAEILAQAKDEALHSMTKKKEEDTAAVSNAEDTEFDVSSSDEEDSITAEDVLDDDKFPNRKVVRRKLVKAQVKLTELIAWLDTMKPGQEADASERQGLEDGDDSERDEEEDAVDFAYGLTALRHTQSYLNKAKREWPEDYST